MRAVILDDYIKYNYILGHTLMLEYKLHNELVAVWVYKALVCLKVECLPL